MSHTTTNGAPVAFVTKGRQRLKQFENTVYLNNGDEFEIELFNPTQNKVLAKIELDGKSIGSGIVLRPAERVFLERYLDIARKFLFETYKVTGSNEQVKQAIAKNGGLSVKFYNEYITPTYPHTLWGGNGIYFGSTNTFGTEYSNYSTTNMPFGSTITNTNSTSTGLNSAVGSTLTSNNFFHDSTASNSGTKTLRTSGLGEVTTDSMSFMSQDLERKTSPIRSPKTRSKLSKEIETGRVEKGSSSNQNFTYDSTSFLSYPSWTSEWKILPTSQKMLVKEDLQVFCTQCGIKRKKDSHKFCPSCGAKY